MVSVIWEAKHQKRFKWCFTIVLMVEEHEGQFECLGENTGKYITFPVPIKKENKNEKTVTYRFLYSIRFMANLLSSLTDNFAKGLHKDRSKDCKSGFEYRTAKEKY